MNDNNIRNWFIYSLLICFLAAVLYTLGSKLRQLFDDRRNQQTEAIIFALKESEPKTNEIPILIEGFTCYRRGDFTADVDRYEVILTVVCDMELLMSYSIARE